MALFSDIQHHQQDSCVVCYVASSFCRQLEILESPFCVPIVAGYSGQPHDVPEEIPDDVFVQTYTRVGVVEIGILVDQISMVAESLLPIA